jgi:uncharacterized protein (DUF302 family)
MLRFALALLAGLLLDGPALAQEEPVVKESRYSVAETADRLQAVIEKNGAMVVARVDHAANAEAVGMELAPTTLMIFGNPMLGTPIMQENSLAGLDLPMKVLIWEEDGATKIAYTSPETLRKRWDVEGHDELFSKMAAGLDKMTDAAAQGE